jgi:hypothetical protein
MSHVGNGAVNGSRTRTTSHAAIDFENITKVAAGTCSRKISASPDRSHGWASLAVSFTKTGKEQRLRAGACLLYETFMLSNDTVTTIVWLRCASAEEGPSGRPARHESAANENAANDKKVEKIRTENTNVDRPRRRPPTSGFNRPRCSTMAS